MPEEIIRYYSQFPVAIPVPGVRHLCMTTPSAAVPGSEEPVLARLACLIHAANVHSEPGSNPSNCMHLTHSVSQTNPQHRTCPNSTEFNSCVCPVAMKDTRQLRSYPKLKVPSTPTDPVVKDQCCSWFVARAATGLLAGRGILSVWSRESTQSIRKS